MLETLGQPVPKVKAIVSHDIGGRLGHPVLMADNDEDRAETEWREAFRDRIRQIQGARTQDDMADLLCISREAYSKYVGGRMSQMPIRLLPRLAKIGAMSLEELIIGRKSVPVAKEKPQKKRQTG